MCSVREVALPDGSTTGHQSIAACLASILEVDVGSVPLPSGDHAEPWTVWHNWLAERGLGLVPVANPATFVWPGPWLALIPAPDGGESRAAVAFGGPPALAWSPLPTQELDQVREGFVLAPADVALIESSVSIAMPADGVVEAIFLAVRAEAELRQVAEARAEAGRGLLGDRYHEGAGTFSNPHARGIDLTLVEWDTIDDMQAAFPGYRGEDTRRNIVTSGIALNALVGRRFRIGEVECIGQRLCEPCAHLDRIAVDGALRHLVHRGGVRADIVTSGRIGIGDPVRPLDRLDDSSRPART